MGNRSYDDFIDVFANGGYAPWWQLAFYSEKLLLEFVYKRFSEVSEDTDTPATEVLGVQHKQPEECNSQLKDSLVFNLIEQSNVHLQVVLADTQQTASKFSHTVLTLALRHGLSQECCGCRLEVLFEDALVYRQLTQYLLKMLLVGDQSITLNATNHLLRVLIVEQVLFPLGFDFQQNLPRRIVQRLQLLSLIILYACLFPQKRLTLPDLAVFYFELQLRCESSQPLLRVVYVQLLAECLEAREIRSAEVRSRSAAQHRLRQNWRLLYDRRYL